MIIACPNCATKFDAGAAQFPSAGRKVKCARCSHIWVQGPQAPELAPAADLSSAVSSDAVVSAPAAVTRSEAPAEMIWAGSDIPRRRPGRGAVLAVGFACFALALAAGIFFREGIARAVPATRQIYTALGFDINVVGIEFRRVEYEAKSDNGVKTLSVTGEIVNVTDEERPVPPIRVALRGNDAKELHAWTFDTGVASLKAGESHAFKEVLAKPPSDASEFEVRFADGGE